GSRYRVDVEHDLVQVDDEAEQIEVERTELQVQDVADFAAGAAGRRWQVHRDGHRPVDGGGHAVLVDEGAHHDAGGDERAVLHAEPFDGEGAIEHALLEGEGVHGELEGRVGRRGCGSGHGKGEGDCD